VCCIFIIMLLGNLLAYLWNMHLYYLLAVIIYIWKLIWNISYYSIGVWSSSFLYFVFWILFHEFGFSLYGALFQYEGLLRKQDFFFPFFLCNRASSATAPHVHVLTNRSHAATPLVIWEQQASRGSVDGLHGRGERHQALRLPYRGRHHHSAEPPRPRRSSANGMAIGELWPSSATANSSTLLCATA
jgi:hypothetical protein